MAAEAASSYPEQEKLSAYLKEHQLTPAFYQVISDRREGRTAWCAIVEVPARAPDRGRVEINARYWFDGRYVNNAKEDAALCAYHYLTTGWKPPPIQTSKPKSYQEKLKEIEENDAREKKEEARRKEEWDRTHGATQ